jgi:hypothetical protein
LRLLRTDERRKCPLKKLDHVIVKLGGILNVLSY